MHEITKTISISVDGKPMDFRLTKLDAFSGASLLRMLSNMPQVSSGDSVMGFITHLSESDLRSLMTSCLNHAEVLLPAGYIPVMTGEDWSWPEAEHDTVTCLKLTMEVALWTLQGFFAEGGPTSRPATANTP